MDLQLLLALLLGIAAIIIIVLKTRLDAFLALLIAALLTGTIAGMPMLDTLSALTTGFGNTLASIGIVIGLGVGIGKILEVSGAADAIAKAFLKAFGKGREEWAMASVGSVVSIPVFVDSAYVIMNPLARSIARVKRGGYVALALALGGGMTLTHHMVPPTPGPLAAAGILGADLGLVVLTGLIFTVILIPVVVIYARWMGPKLEEELLPDIREAVYGKVEALAEATGSATLAAVGARIAGDDKDEPAAPTFSTELDEVRPDGAKPHKIGALLGSIPLVVPLLLILANTLTVSIDRNQQGILTGDFDMSNWVRPFAFLGHPVVALIIGLVLAVYVLLPRWTPQKKVASWLSQAAASAGSVLLITGAGGGFGLVLRQSGVGDALAEAIGSINMPAFLVPFIVASLVRLAQGSGTVAIITAASVTAPLLGTLGLNPVVAVLATTTGSILFSYFNDSMYWVFTRFTGLEGISGVKAWSGITTAIWVASIPLLFITYLIM